MIATAEDLFSKLQPEEEQKMQEFKLENNPTVDALVNGFIELAREMIRDECGDIFDASKVLDTITYNAQDVAALSIRLGDVTEQGLLRGAAGYLSEVVNSCEDDDITIYTRHLPELDGLGSVLRGKTLRVEGTVGPSLGWWMESGLIIVKGNVGSRVGQWMHGGKIIVYGDAGESAGHKMCNGELHIYGNAQRDVGAEQQGGTIIIEGDAGSALGRYKKGGEIHVNGDIDTIFFKDLKGNIYHKGKQIVKDGVLIK